MRLLFNVNIAWFFISHRLEIARAARDKGFEVHVSADLDSPEEAALLEREGFRFHRVRLRRGGLSPAYDLLYFRRLRAIMKSVAPDLVHNVTVKPVIYGTMAARGLGISRIVNAVSGLGYAFTGAESRRLLAHLVKMAYRTALNRPYVRVIFQNADDIETFTAANIIAKRQVVLIKGSGVDLEAYACDPESPGTPVVMLPARMLRDKGVVEFANAAKGLRAQGVAAEFVLAGMTDRANPASLAESDMERLEQDTGVKWLGHVPDMPALYRKSHIVCLPSYREGMPKSLLEACAAGRPIVATDVPGCREVVRHGENGLLVAPRNVAALADGLGQLLADSSLRKRMGAAGRQRAEAEFDVRAVVRATMDVYQSMLA
jgi:glycosyltransferase involved in cell wall biosynthesis